MFLLQLLASAVSLLLILYVLNLSKSARRNGQLTLRGFGTIRRTDYPPFAFWWFAHAAPWWIALIVLGQLYVIWSFPTR